MAPGLRHLTFHLLRAGGLLLFGITLVFFVIHVGPAAPADQSAVEAGFQDEAEFEQQKRAFGLRDPLWKQYGTYVIDMFTLNFGETWTERKIDITENQATNDVDAIVANRLKRTAWLWLWTLLIALGFVTVAAVSTRNRSADSVAIATGLSGALPAFLLAVAFETGFTNLGRLLFGFDWQGFLVETPIVTRPIPVEELGSTNDILLASKLAIPPALALAIPVASIVTFVWHRSYLVSAGSDTATAAEARGLHRGFVILKHVFPNSLLPWIPALHSVVIVVIGGTVLVESVFRLEGLGSLLLTSVLRKDFTTLQASMFVFLAVVAGSILLKGILQGFLYGAPERPVHDHINRLTDYTKAKPTRSVPVEDNLRPVGMFRSVRHNVRTAPVSAVLWISVAVLLFSLEFGAVLETVQSLLPGVPATNGIPTLLDRSLISNQGHRMPGGGWTGTFFGLSPAQAWGLRVSLVYVYAVACVGWLVLGYRVYREEYRPRAQTRIDVMLAKFRRNRVGMFGAVVVFLLLVSAIFAPTVATTPLEETQAHTSHSGTGPGLNGEATVTYLDSDTGTVETTSVRDANFGSASNPQKGVGPVSYDEYDRFHPLGTTTEGTDLLTELLHGLRVYALVAGGGGFLAGLVALLLTGVASYGNGHLKTGVKIAANATAVFPLLPLVLIVSIYFYPRLSSIRMQLFVWALLFGLVGGMRLWKAVEPAVSRTKARVYADRAIGLSPRHVEARVVRRNVDRVLPPLLVYSLTSASGFVVTVAALSYLGHLAPAVAPFGVYDWGSFLWLGKSAVLSESSHLFVVPAVLLVVLISGLYSIAVGLREALDVERRIGITALGEVTRIGEG